MNEYPNLDIKDMDNLETSVNKEEYRKDTKYNEQLIEFLKPTLQLQAAKTYKTYRKYVKTYT